ncbi:ribose-phosphate diphosphokinase [Fulvivirgaceae bacterium BMA12]|uniref:ribose-phosphate diphosphokinase n=1 Tax=Agaribacillus aureus TaxID=3051825 RepID=A0ABT8L1K2_9BACT|nr:ribose-phosphate diphosphokinase [Fulvivirgaceae bacterium BMA12]
MTKDNNLIFSTENYAYLKDKIIEQGGFYPGKIEKKIFPDGERYQRILSDVDGKDVIVIGGTISDSDTLELYDLAYAVVRNGALSLTVVIPYYGYSTMERAIKPGEIVTAKTRASLFSSLPQTSRRNRFMFMDLHSEGLPHYFEGSVVPVHLYCKSIILDAAQRLGGDNFVLACTDSGRAKWVESLANDINVNAAFVFKRRISGEETEITSISADVKNKTVVIYDDMIRTGGSLINAANAYHEAGAKKICVIATHGLFNKDALQKIKESTTITAMVCTDTHPNVLALENNFLTVESVASLIAQKLKSF